MDNWLVLLLLTAARVDAASLGGSIVFTENDNNDAATSRLIASHFSPEEQACFKEEKFLYEQDKKCYSFLTEGPCSCRAARQNTGRSVGKSCDEKGARWLVLDKENSGKLRAVCRPCPCCDRALHVFMATDRKCHHRTKELDRFCPLAGHELRDDDYGEGECACIRTPPHAHMLGDKSGICYPLYRRGPCTQGHVLLPDRDKRTLESVARCAVDVCAHKGEGYAQWKVGDGKCYHLGSQGPCDAQSKFYVQRTTRIPDCSQPANAVVNPKEFSLTQSSVMLPHVDKDYALDLLSTRGKRRTRKSVQ